MYVPSRGTHTTTKEAGSKTGMIVNFATNNVHGDKQESNMDLSRFPNKRRRRHLRAPRLSLFCLRSIHTVSSQKCWSIAHIKKMSALVSVRPGACLPHSTVIVRRWACPASSEVHADFVRKRACPSSSEVHADIARRKGCVQSFLLRSTQRRRRCTRGSCDSSEEATVDAEEDAGLGVWRACLSTPKETHNQRTTGANIPNCATPQSTASKHPELCATH